MAIKNLCNLVRAIIPPRRPKQPRIRRPIKPTKFALAIVLAVAVFLAACQGAPTLAPNEVAVTVTSTPSPTITNTPCWTGQAQVGSSTRMQEVRVFGNCPGVHTETPAPQREPMGNHARPTTDYATSEPSATPSVTPWPSATPPPPTAMPPQSGITLSVTVNIAGDSINVSPVISNTNTLYNSTSVSNTVGAGSAPTVRTSSTGTSHVPSRNTMPPPPPSPVAEAVCPPKPCVCYE